MSQFYALQDLFDVDADDAEKNLADCASCPVNIECVLGESGPPRWKFNCCGATAVSAPDRQTDDEHEYLFIVDCNKNSFKPNKAAHYAEKCPLCNGHDAAFIIINGMADNQRYVPTIHAKIPVKKRLTVLKNNRERAQETLTKIRNKNG